MFSLRAKGQTALIRNAAVGGDIGRMPIHRGKGNRKTREMKISKEGGVRIISYRADHRYQDCEPQERTRAPSLRRCHKRGADRGGSQSAFLHHLPPFPGKSRACRRGGVGEGAFSLKY